MARTSAKAKKLKQVGSNNNKKTQNIEDTSNENKQEENQATDDATDKENDDVNYEVEKIVHTRVYRGKRQYLVRWKGYSEDSDTWENESVVQSCQEALEAFNKNKPQDDSDNDGDDEDTEESTKEETKVKNKASPKGHKKTTTNTQKKGKKSVTTNTDDEDMEVDSDEREKKEKKKDSLSARKNKGRGDNEEPSKKKTKSNDSSDESVTDGKNYEVEKILEVHIRKDKTREFLIRWKGYKPNDDTWEPEAHLDCQEMIDKFMERVDKAKSIPARELRESRTPANRFISHARHGRGNGFRLTLRNNGLRPCYQE